MENKFDAQNIEVVFNIQSASSWLNGILSNELKRSNITVQQFQLLRILSERSESVVNIRLLTSFMPDRASNVSRLVDKLEEKKWVFRQELANDKRKVHISLTESGQAFIKSTSDSVAQVLNQHLDKFSEAEIELLNQLLEKVIQ